MTLYDNALIYAPNIFFFCVGVLFVAVVFGMWRFLRVLTRIFLVLALPQGKKGRAYKTDVLRRIQAIEQKILRLFAAIKKEVLIDEP